ncbi:MAG: IS701 family transposase [Chloroflexota bacterium]|nr:IS701 family transposase [Chloroflexota bacterium]
MTTRLPVDPAPGPLEPFAQHFDPLFPKRSQRQAFRDYLAALLLPTERNKTLTALANTEPIVGAQAAPAQRLQWFLSESTWDADAVNACRLAALSALPATAPEAHGALVIDETGDRKDGTHTAHVGRQYLGSIGKIDNGVVSVGALWADERVYYPLDVEPYTPAHWFVGGKNDPAFRTKPQIALALVEQAVAANLPFRAVVADCFYGEHDAFRVGLHTRGIGYVLALQPSHAWWHPIDTLGSLWEIADAAAWAGADHPGDWRPVARTFRDGHTETWWALEIVAGPYGPEKPTRAVVATTDPATLPALSTWYLVTNLPAPHPQQRETVHPAADLAAVVRLYGLRTWVEQSYKQVKQSLGWAQYQVRSDRAIRRHWQLVCCAFAFCWWAAGQGGEATTAGDEDEDEVECAIPATETVAGRGENGGAAARGAPAGLVAGGGAGGTGVVGAVDAAHALVAGVERLAPAICRAAIA